LGIRSYGISVTTLEEVFLRVGGAGNDLEKISEADVPLDSSSLENPNPFSPDKE
jgi:hypothetical protein